MRWLMRELSPWARKSQGRSAHRAFYDGYITSAAWYRRREQWAKDEEARIAPAQIKCRGGCGKPWRVDRDDLHHCDYRSLGDEAHEDLWAMCRTCHMQLHDLLESSRSWRRLPKRQANRQAITVLTHRGTAVSSRALGRYL